MTLPRRARTALAALGLATCSTVALATGPVPARAATTAEPVAPTTQVEYGEGHLETTHVELTGRTGRSATDPAPGAATTPPASTDGAPGGPTTTTTTTATTPGVTPGATGWTTQVALAPGTEMVALTWDAASSAPDGELEIRSRTAGTWSPWDHAHAEDGEGDPTPGGATRVGTGVIWLGQEGADAVELRVEAGPLNGLTLLRMDAAPREVRTVTEAPAAPTASRAATKPNIHPRSDWASGGWKYTTDGCASGPSIAGSLKHAVVHHTAGSNSYSVAQVPDVIDGIYAYHTLSPSAGGRGWCDIAYNFLIDKYGGIWQGRTGDMAKPVVGGHAQGFNTGSVGLNLIGNFQTAQPSSAMMDSAAKFLAWKLSLHGLDPQGTVTVESAGNPRYTAGTRVTLPVVNYHGQTGYTECPGQYVIAKMPALRDATKWYMSGSGPTDPPPPTEPPPPAIDWKPFDSAEDTVWKQYVDFRRDPGQYEDRKWWFTELKAGRTNRNALVAALIRSPWVEDKSLDAVRLYLTYFGRIPDSAGIRYWWSEVDAGRNIRTVSARFSGSPEFKKTYGNLNDTEFVKLVYRNVLGRAATQADLDYWVGQIANGKDSRGGVMALFSKTKEYKDKSRTVVEVILVHEVMLGRAINPQSHMQWVATVQSDGIGSLIGTLFTSDEYAQRVGG